MTLADLAPSDDDDGDEDCAADQERPAPSTQNSTLLPHDQGHVIGAREDSSGGGGSTTREGRCLSYNLRRDAEQARLHATQNDTYSSGSRVASGGSGDEAEPDDGGTEEDADTPRIAKRKRTEEGEDEGEDLDEVQEECEVATMAEAERARGAIITPILMTRWIK